jgi:hypothetical protein
MGSSEQRLENETDFPDGSGWALSHRACHRPEDFAARRFATSRTIAMISRTMSPQADLQQILNGSPDLGFSVIFVHKIPIEFIWYASVISPVDA